MSSKVERDYQKFIQANSASLVAIDANPQDYMPAAGSTDVDESNPRSVINLLPKWLKTKIKSIPSDNFLLTEEELIDRLYPNGRISPVINRLRIQFWDEYDRVQIQALPEMEIKRVTERVCSRTYFTNVVCVDTLALVFLLTPPTAYLLTMKECLQMGVTRMREVMSVSPVGKNGFVNEKLAEIQHRMFITLDQRINGAIAQRIDQRILTANVTPEQAGANPKAMSLDEIQRRIKELENAQTREVLPPSAVTVDLMREVTDAKADTISRDLDTVGVERSQLPGV